MSHPSSKDPESYVEALYSLMPEGRSFSRNIASNIWKLLRGIAGEFARIGISAEQVELASSPSTVEEFIDRWEEVVGLDPKTQQALSFTERRIAVINKLLGDSHLTEPQAIEETKSILEEFFIAPAFSADDPNNGPLRELIGARLHQLYYLSTFIPENSGKSPSTWFYTQQEIDDAKVVSPETVTVTTRLQPAFSVGISAMGDPVGDEFVGFAYVDIINNTYFPRAEPFVEALSDNEPFFNAFEDGYRSTLSASNSASLNSAIASVGANSEIHGYNVGVAKFIEDNLARRKQANERIYANFLLEDNVGIKWDLRTGMTVSPQGFESFNQKVLDFISQTPSYAFVTIPPISNTDILHLMSLGQYIYALATYPQAQNILTLGTLSAVNDVSSFSGAILAAETSASNGAMTVTLRNVNHFPSKDSLVLPIGPSDDRWTYMYNGVSAIPQSQGAYDTLASLIQSHPDDSGESINNLNYLRDDPSAGGVPFVQQHFQEMAADSFTINIRLFIEDDDGDIWDMSTGQTVDE